MATYSAGKNGASQSDSAMDIADAKIRAYFAELDALGDISRASNDVIVKRPNAGNSRVGARPVSGIRGLYFSKGTWRVNFLDDRFRIVPCHFKYEDSMSLVRTYHLAHEFLKRVIELKRHVNEDDGTIIEHLTDAMLVELDKRKSRKGQRKSPVITPARITPYDKKQIMDNLSYKRVRSKERPRQNGDPDYDPDSNKKRKVSSPKFINGNGHVGRPRKLTKLEEKLLEYSELSTLEMVHRVIEENSEARESDHGKTYAARNKEREALRQEFDKKYDEIFGKDTHLNGVNGTGEEILRKCSFKEDMDKESRLNGMGRGSGTFEEFIVLQGDGDEILQIKSYTFDNCFK